MKKRLLPIFLMILCFLLTSCASQKNISCDAVLSKLLTVSGEAPRRNGQVFLLGAEEGRIEYFSDENKALMYGDNALKHCFPRIEDCAIYVSAHIPEELAVFKCYSSSDTDEIVKMCLERADMIKVTLRGSEWQEKAEKIRITTYRRFVVFSFTDHSEKIESKLKEML